MLLQEIEIIGILFKIKFVAVFFLFILQLHISVFANSVPVKLETLSRYVLRS